MLLDHDSKIVQPTWIGSSLPRLDFGGPTDVAYDSDTARDFEAIPGVEVIERAARNNPDRIAIDDGTVRLTYAQFVDRVYGLAERLQSMTEHGAIVASVVPNDAAAPIIIMACALAGRTLVPIDATHPRDRQQAIFAESGARLVLLAKDKIGDISFMPPDVPTLVVDPQLVTHASRPPTHYDRNAPLYVGFTSGSTGRPKGVASGGRYGGTALRQFIDMFHINPTDVVLGLASLSTGGARDAFAALGAGATIRTFDMRSGGLSELLRVLDGDKISVLSFVPSALRVIIGIDGAERAFRHLRILDLHGERILASDIALFRGKLPPTCHISVTMGSIEAGAVFSWFVRDDQIHGGVVPVGYLLPSRCVALLDEDGRSVADGEVGELFVRGAMALGAWRNGCLVPGPFLPDPLDGTSSIYPMGDLVRKRPDGLFEYVGRKDRRVKVRGLWADLGEVEAALRGIDGVTDAVALSESNDADGEKIFAFIVMADGIAAPSVNIIRHTVAKETADHMAPAVVCILDSIPRLANFKPDLVRLRAMSTPLKSPQ